MGSIVSQEVYSMLDEDPSKSPKSSLRTVAREFDPRSPTVGVDRTPIQIAATPDLLIDPRSPSYGIDRTPIYHVNNLEGGDTSFPVAAGVDVVAAEECGEPVRKVLVVPFNLMDADEDSVTPRGTDDVLVPVPVTPIIDFSDYVLPQRTDLKEVEEHPTLTSTNTEILKPQTAKVLCDLPKTKVLQPVVIPLCPPSQRSPLGTRNVQSGSLRSMVQLKEARKVESMRKSPGDSLRARNGGIFIDKENR